MLSRFKIFSDPVHGFVSVPKKLILDLIGTPEFQRLRRIRQLGLGHLVFPGAEHTRFGHALGAMALMQDALKNLQEKGTPVSPEEYEAAQAVALLHDVGHGPFSHTLEKQLISNYRHEQMSRALIAQLDARFSGALEMALAMFDNAYERPFFHQLISSQLDMDRLDYLRRDSFYTGVAEGVTGVNRLIKTLRVHPTEGGPEAEVVIESKGVYAVENFLISRRLMYWQVYLHKTVLAGDHLLRNIIRRVRHLLGGSGEEPGGSPALLYFLRQQLSARDIALQEVQHQFCQLDDVDVMYSLKCWAGGKDALLADLASRFVNRDLFRVVFLDAPPTHAQVDAWQAQAADWLVRRGLVPRVKAHAAAGYYVDTALSRHSAYERLATSIGILDRDGQRRELSEVSDTGAVRALAQSVEKPYVYFPKDLAFRLTP